MKRIFVAVLVLIALTVWAAGPWGPTITWQNPWSTNRPPRQVEGFNNLAITNLESGTDWWFYSIGPKTVARLIDVTNIASTFSGDAGGTNARQFGTLTLTNWSDYNTNTIADTATNLGNSRYLAIQGGEGNNNYFTNVHLTGASILADATTVIFAGGDVSASTFRVNAGEVGFIQQDYIGTPSLLKVDSLSGLFVPSSYTDADIANLQGGTNGLNTRVGNLEGSSNLTAYALISSVTYLTNWANAVSNYVTASTNSASITNWINTRQPASANLTNWSNIPTGAMANAISTDFLTNWANAVSNYVTAATNSTSVTNWINSRQPADAHLSNIVGLVSTVFTNVPLGGTNISVRTTGGTNFFDTTGHLNNWSQIPTGAMANIVSSDFLTNWSGAISNLAQTKQNGSAKLTNIVGLADNTFTNVPLGGTNISVRTTGGTNFIDTTGHLNNWSQIPTGAMANVVSANFLTNWANAISNYVTAATNSASVTNWINSSQPANSTLTNLASNPYVAYTNILTKTATTVSGAGSGSTNYLITLSTNSINYFYLGSSNVNVYTVGGSTLGSPITWTAIITNLSANVWGFTVASGTNRWKWFHYAYGTNRPITLTNNTALCLNGQSDGTNTLVSYYYFAPGL